MVAKNKKAKLKSSASQLTSLIRQMGSANLNQRKVAKPKAARAMSGMGSTTLGSAAARYAAALCDPFTKEAEGVRVPEPYAVPTVTRKVHVPIVLTSSAGGGIDFSVQPHLISSFVQTLGTMSGGAGALGPLNAPAGLSLRSAVTEANIRSLLQSYRIVAIGVRLKTNVDFTKSGGRVYGAILPATMQQPSAFNLATTLPQALGCYQIPNDGTNVSTAILGLPRGFQFTVSELMSEGGCEIHFPICAASALDFIEGQTQEYEQHFAVTGAAGAQVAAQGFGVYMSNGHSQFVLRGEGLNPSTDVLTAEVIYHVEGIPLVGTASLIESTPHTPAPATPNEIHMAHRIAAMRPVVAYVSDKLKASATKRFGAEKVGSAERVLGLAVRGVRMLL